MQKLRGSPLWDHRSKKVIGTEHPRIPEAHSNQQSPERKGHWSKWWRNLFFSSTTSWLILDFRLIKNRIMRKWMDLTTEQHRMFKSALMWFHTIKRKKDRKYFKIFCDMFSDMISMTERSDKHYLSSTWNTSLLLKTRWHFPQAPCLFQHCCAEGNRRWILGPPGLENENLWHGK